MLINLFNRQFTLDFKLSLAGLKPSLDIKTSLTFGNVYIKFSTTFLHHQRVN